MAFSLDSLGMSIKPITLCRLESFSSPVLDHGYPDVIFFPSWSEFLERSQGSRTDYPGYMAYLVFKNEALSEPIGVIAVQITTYDVLKVKVPVVLPEYETYLYLSWIALSKHEQDKKFFGILFDFYKSVVKQLASSMSKKIGGATIVIRRMRPILAGIPGTSSSCPQTRDRTFTIENKKMQFIFMPSEMLPNPHACPA